MNFRFIFFGLLYCGSFLSCKKNFEDISSYNPLKDTSWCPLYSGYWTEYQVDSVFYKKSSIDTLVFIERTTSFMKEIIGSKITQFGNDIEYEIDIYIKRNINDNYVFYKKNSVKRVNTMMIYNRNNLQFINLVFPISENISWKGNQLIQTTDDLAYLSDWNYIYKNVNQSVSVLNNTFTQSVYIQKANEENAIEKLWVYDYYANNIGLVFSQESNLKKQNVLNDWSKPENGYTITKQIIDWKK
jgi:hypothetical protein